MDLEAVFVNHRGGRLTTTSVRLLVKKYARLGNIDWNLHPHSLRHAFATHLLGMARTCAQFRTCWDTCRFRPRSKPSTQASIEELMAVYDKSHPHA